MPDIREEFEAFAKSHYFLKELGLDLDPHVAGEYSEPEMQYAWEAWQASRAALKVEIPKPESWMRYEDHIDRIMEAIQQAGIEVVK